MKLNSADVICWFNAIRDLPDSDRTRALDALWAGQIDSKTWLVDSLKPLIAETSNVYIFGGWIGILASMLLQECDNIKQVRSIDIDPWCEAIADTVCKPYEMDSWRFKAVTCDMQDYSYEWGIPPHIVINTSCEHIDQDTYDFWYDNIPIGTIIVIQGNNFFDCSEHIRCSNSLEEFKQQHNVVKTLYEGSLDHDLYTRYMCIWRK
jgi:hypothetical protein